MSTINRGPTYLFALLSSATLFDDGRRTSVTVSDSRWLDRRWFFVCWSVVSTISRDYQSVNRKMSTIPTLRNRLSVQQRDCKRSMIWDSDVGTIRNIDRLSIVDMNGLKPRERFFDYLQITMPVLNSNKKTAVDANWKLAICPWLSFRCFVLTRRRFASILLLRLWWCALLRNTSVSWCGWTQKNECKPSDGVYGMRLCRCLPDDGVSCSMF